MRRVGHGLLAAGDDDVELTGADQLVGQRDRVEPGEADLVDGQRGHVHRDARLDGGLARRDLARSGLEHLAHDHVLTWSPPIPARSSAALMAKPPRSAPEKDLSDPSSRPMGVRAPATITEVVPYVSFRT